MECEAAGGIGGRAVFAIAYDGVTEGGELDADLVFAAGLEGQLEQRVDSAFV